MANYKINLRIGIVCLVIALIGISILAIFYELRYPHENDYAVVFDAGSSGTRMFVYKWLSGYSAAKGDELVIEQDFYCQNNDNGIDKLKSENETFDKFNKCLKDAENHIPKNRQDRAYVFLAATAGMRLLEIKNKTQTNEILNYIRKVFKRTNFLFKNESQVRIISGQEEGINAWISVNYFQKNFKPNPSSSDELIGTLDLGGASTQIVFVPKKNVIDSKNIYKVKIYGVDYMTYSQSYLCWGLNEFKRLYKSYVIRQQNYTNNIDISCYPSSFNESSNEIFNSFCIDNNDSPKMEKEFTFKGTSNTNMCRKEIKNLISKKSCKNNSNGECFLNDPDQPELNDIKFMAFSAYFYGTKNAYRLLNETFEEDINKFTNITNKICSMGMDELTQLNYNNKDKIKHVYLETLCITNAYILELLNSFGFKDLWNVKIANTVNGYNIGWTLGYLVNELNRDHFLPYEIPKRRLQFKYFLPLIIITSFVFVFSLIFVIFFIHKRFKYSVIKT